MQSECCSVRALSMIAALCVVTRSHSGRMRMILPVASSAFLVLIRMQVIILCPQVAKLHGKVVRAQ